LPTSRGVPHPGKGASATPAPSSDSSRDPDNLRVERETRRKYRTWYTPRNLNLKRFPRGDCFRKLAALRLELIGQACPRGRVLDLCCGSGDYLLPTSCRVEQIIGVDFSPELIAAARRRAARRRRRNSRFCIANARALPLDAGSIALIFCFASLYHIPRADQVVRECYRVLEPDGVALLEFGGLYSLNTIVCRAAPDLAEPCHLPLGAIRRIVTTAGFTVEQERHFQILPLWGDAPRWLRPLLHPGWRRLMAREVRGRLLDEWISSAWPLRHFAFRHVFTCRRPAD
jgi:SAM-dependent methyltransferase